MATATRKRNGSKNGTKATMELAVTFGNVNIGDETARVGISISRANLTVSQADKTLCGNRLTGKIVARSFGANAEQDSLPGLEDDAELEGVFDVGGFNASPKKIGCGLTFLLTAIDVTTLARFAKREGLLLVYGVEAIPEGEAESDD